MTFLNGDRRQASRLEVALEVYYDSSSIHMAGAAVSSLSQTGLFLRSQYLDDPGVLVALALSLPTERRPLTIAGKVVRVDTRPTSAGMGIRFTDLSIRSRERLARFVQDRDSKHLS